MRFINRFIQHLFRPPAHHWLGLAGSVLFCFGGLLVLSGVFHSSTSIFSRAGGATIALLFLWIAILYARKLTK